MAEQVKLKKFHVQMTVKVHEDFDVNNRLQVKELEAQIESAVAESRGVSVECLVFKVEDTHDW